MGYKEDASKTYLTDRERAELAASYIYEAQKDQLTIRQTAKDFRVSVKSIDRALVRLRSK